MHVRQPAVAGRFYPGTQRQCLAEVQAHCRNATSTVRAPIGGIVPHAGWVFSGGVAADVIHSVAEATEVETYVVFGAAHRRCGPHASVFTRGAWDTPLGRIVIDEELAAAVTKASDLIREDPAAHGMEHSIEVQIPFIQHLSPDAGLLPVMVPPIPQAAQIGQTVAQQVAEIGRAVLYLASTDLTHYGPNYAFTPEGVGAKGLRWAKDVNDQRMIDLIEKFEADRVVSEALEHQNACGAGAVAATIAACRLAGATEAHVLQHTTSYEVAPYHFSEPSDAVGYAGIVFSGGQA
jgi:AmmeMemoRadiSam system protein B